MFELEVPHTVSGNGGRVQGGLAYTRPVRRRRTRCMEVNDPGIPGSDNWWCVNSGAARSLALRRVSQSGPGHRVVHDSRPIHGWPHFHIVDRYGRRLSGHFFYGGRPPLRLYRGRPNRELEFNTGKDHFVVETRGPFGVVLVPEGHEVLTRRATGGLTLSGAEVAALIEGVRRVDTVPLWYHFKSDQQRRHALRRELCTTMSAALTEIRNHLIRLHSVATGATSRLDAMRWIGEALHLIQDSFSEAHTEREWRITGPPHPIRFIRYFGPRGRTFPDEHRVVPAPDPRDIITVPGGGLRFAAVQSVLASNEFLRMMLRHLATPGASSHSGELRTFMDRHLVLSATPREPRAWYSSC